MPTPYETLFAAVSPILEDFRNDLEKHDKRQLEEYPDAPFLHWAKPSGTHIVSLIGADKYPPPGKTQPYLFGHKERHGLLNAVLDFTKAMGKYKDYPLIHYWDGKRIKKIDQYRAEEIARSYIHRIEKEWKADA